MTDHVSSFDDDDGWVAVRCTCGFAFGPVPDMETAADVWGDHRADLAAPDSEAQAVIDAAIVLADTDEAYQHHADGCMSDPCSTCDMWSHRTAEAWAALRARIAERAYSVSIDEEANQ